jgi:hypothetical protein
MPSVGFEPTILVFQWAKLVHALDRAATVLGRNYCTFETTGLFGVCPSSKLIDEVKNSGGPKCYTVSSECKNSEISLP